MDKITDFELNSPRWLSLENFEGEIWKDVVNYEGLYSISNLGRIKSNDNVFAIKNRWGTITYRKKKGKVLKSRYDISGYLTVGLHKDGIAKNRFVHRLMAEAFIPNPLNKEEVDHINTNKSDFRLSNLRWVTKSENALNPITLLQNKMIQGSPVVVLDCWGNYVTEYFSVKEASEKLGVSDTEVLDAIKRNRECVAAAGYIVVYKEDYDKEKNYKLMYKKGTSPYKHIPCEKMVIAYDNKEKKIINVFYNTSDAAKHYDAHVSSIKQRIRKCQSGDTTINNTNAKILDDLYYITDITEKEKEVALSFFKEKYGKESPK